MLVGVEVGVEVGVALELGLLMLMLLLAFPSSGWKSARSQFSQKSVFTQLKQR